MLQNIVQPTLDKIPGGFNISKASLTDFSEG